MILGNTLEPGAYLSDLLTYPSGLLQMQNMAIDKKACATHGRHKTHAREI